MKPLQLFIFAMHLLASMLVVGCDVDREASKLADRLTRQVQSQATTATTADGILRRSSEPYLGEVRTEPVGPILPPRVESEAGITLSLTEPLTPAELGERIERATDIPVVVNLDPELQPSADENTVVEQTLRYIGPLSALLDQLGTRWDAEWTFDNDVIEFTNARTSIYQVRASTSSSEISVQSSGTGGDTGSQQTSLQTQVSFWEEIEATLTGLIAIGTYQLSPATGLVTVTAPPSVHRKVRNYFEEANTIFDARISIEVIAAFLDVSDTDEFGFSLDFIHQAFANDAKIRINPTTRSESLSDLISFSVNSDADGRLSDVAGSTAVLQALASTDRVVDYRTVNTITRHGSPVPISLTRQQDYVSKVTVTTTDGSSSKAIEPDTLNTGLSISLYPRVVKQDQVQLTLSLVASDLIRFEDSNAGEDTIKLPTVEERRLMHDLVLAADETILLAGYEQQKAGTLNSGVGSPSFKLLGGRTVAGTTRTRLFLLVSARVLR